MRIIKKTPIVVNDSRGFYANRCVLNYVREGQIMLIEGVPPAMIENVARMAGMPVGPLSLNDEVALDLGWKILNATKKDLGAAAVDPAQERVLRFMVEEQGRFGRKNGKGFYDYHPDGKKSLWPGLSALAEKNLDPDTLDVDELKQRFLVVQAVEAARTMAEGVVTDPREADVGSILGFGFAPFTGGTLSYIDGMGRKPSSPFATRSPRNMARASNRRNCCARWPRRGNRSMAVSCRNGRRPDAPPLADAR